MPPRLKFLQVLFLGAPGVGKGTYARRAAPVLGFGHLSPGDLLRKRATQDESVSSYLDKGLLVPEDLVFQLVSDELNVLGESNLKGVILDGFPRSVDQAKGWIERHRAPIPDLVVELHLPEHLLINKMLGRRLCSQCGDLYNVFSFTEGDYSMPAITPRIDGICDKCEGQLVHRSDDKLGVIRERLDAHWKRETLLIDYLKTRTDNFVSFHVKTGIAQLDELVSLIKARLS